VDISGLRGEGEERVNKPCKDKDIEVGFFDGASKSHGGSQVSNRISSALKGWVVGMKINLSPLSGLVVQCSHDPG